MQPFWSWGWVEEDFENTQWSLNSSFRSIISLPKCFPLNIWKHTKVKQMWPVWLWRWFEEAFENTQWRKFKQLQPMWLCRWFEEAFENTLLSLNSSSQSIISLPKCFPLNIWKHTEEKSQANETSVTIEVIWGSTWKHTVESKPLFSIHHQSPKVLSSQHLKTHSGEKSNKCNQCDSGDDFMKNLETHSWVSILRLNPSSVSQSAFLSTFENTQQRKVN